MALGSTQPLTEMSTRCIFWEWRRPVLKADNLTTILCRCHEIWEALTSWNPLGHSRPVTGLLYLLSWNLEALTSWNPLGHSRPVTGLLYLYLYLSDFNQTWIYAADFRKIIKNQTLWKSAQWDRRTHRHDAANCRLSRHCEGVERTLTSCLCIVNERNCRSFTDYTVDGSNFVRHRSAGDSQTSGKEHAIVGTVRGAVWWNEVGYTVHSLCRFRCTVNEYLTYAFNTYITHIWTLCTSRPELWSS